MISETNSMIKTTYPKITFVITKQAIEKEVKKMSFQDMASNLKFFMNKKHTRLIKNHVRLSVIINGSI